MDGKRNEMPGEGGVGSKMKGAARRNRQSNKPLEPTGAARRLAVNRGATCCRARGSAPRR